PDEPLLFVTDESHGDHPRKQERNQKRDELSKENRDAEQDDRHPEVHRVPREAKRPGRDHGRGLFGGSDGRPCPMELQPSPNRERQSKGYERDPRELPWRRDEL